MVGPPARIERALVLLVPGHDVDGPRVGRVRRSARRRGQAEDPSGEAVGARGAQALARRGLVGRRAG